MAEDVQQVQAVRETLYDTEDFDEDEVGYNNVRKHFAWVKYVFKLNR